MSNDKMLALRGRRARWVPVPKDTGPIDPSRLPEGYPYKEVAGNVVMDNVVVDSSTGTQYMYDYHKHALDIVDHPKYTKAIVTFDGVEYQYTLADCPVLTGVTNDGEVEYGVSLGNPYHAAKAQGAPDSVLENITNSGEPFTLELSDGSYPNTPSDLYTVDGETHTVTVVMVGETIHPMSEEFLPEGVGGGVPSYQFITTMGTLDGATFDELAAAYPNFTLYPNTGRYLLYPSGYLVDEATIGFVGFNVYNSKLVTATLNSNGKVTATEHDLTTTA